MAMAKLFEKLSLAIMALAIIIFAGPANGQEAEENTFSAEQFFEAEAGNINRPMQQYSSKDASGGQYLMNHYTTTRRIEDPALQAEPDVSFAMDIPADGDYFLWLRVKVPASGEIFGQYLTFYAGTGDANYNVCLARITEGWEWQRITNLRLEKGKTTIDFKHKDFGFGIDKVFLTATGLDLSSLGMNPTREEMLRANFNEPTTIEYPPLTESDGLGLDFPKPPAEHPRLFLRKKDIPLLLEKTKNPLMKAAWDKIVASSRVETDGMLDAPVDGRANFEASAIQSIEAKALMYALYQDKEQGRKAVEAMLNFFNTVKFNPSTGDISRIYGRYMVSCAIVYDWCYDLLSNEEKKDLIAWAETMASRFELGWPVIRQGAVTGHGSEFQLMRDLMAAGIAMYDEKQEIYNRAAGRFFKNYVPARKFFYPAGYHHQGSSYGGYRFMTELYATALFDRMGYPKIFGEDQAKVPYFAIYTRRPDGQIMREGDDYTSRSASGYWSRNGASDVLAASFFKDPVVMGEAVRELKGFGQTGDYLFDFLLIDPSVKPAPLDKLPLSRFFPSPLGAMVARTGWKQGMDSPDVVAVMKIGEYQFVNHQHYDAGNFQIYYKGALASEGGTYDAYGSDHDYNYHKRTIAHNTMLIYDPDEKFPRNLVNDGGQRFPNDGREASTIDIIKEGHKVAEVIAHHFGPDPHRPEYTYMKGDLTHAYTDKVKQFQRSFVFLNLGDKKRPAALIVFDKVISSNKDFRKTWLLHCIEEPDIEGSETTIVRTQKQYNGKMTNTTLWPQKDNLLITRVGGFGREFEVNGINHPARNVPDPEKTSDESGSWKIEVSPKTSSTDDIFLNVMQFMENDGGPSPLMVSGLNSNELAGASIADRIVLFSKTGDRIGGSFQVALEGKGKLKTLIVDLKEGYWKIGRTGEKSKVYPVDKSGVLYFHGKPGDYGFEWSEKAKGEPSL